MLKNLQNKIHKQLRCSYEAGHLPYKQRFTIFDAVCKLELSEEELALGSLLPPLVFYLPHEIFSYKNLFCSSCKTYGGLRKSRFIKAPRVLLTVEETCFIDFAVYRCKCGHESNSFSVAPLEQFVAGKKYVLTKALSQLTFALTPKLGAKGWTDILNSLHQQNHLEKIKSFLLKRVKLPRVKLQSKLRFVENSQSTVSKKLKLSSLLFKKTSLNRLPSCPQKLKLSLKKGGVNCCEDLLKVKLEKSLQVKTRQRFYERLFALGFTRPNQKKHYYKSVSQVTLWQSKARPLVRTKKAIIIQSVFRLYLRNQRNRQTITKSQLLCNRSKEREKKEREKKEREERARKRKLRLKVVQASLNSFNLVSHDFVQAHFQTAVLCRSKFTLQSHFSRLVRGCQTLRIDVCYKPSARAGEPFKGILTVLNGEGYVLLCNLLFTNESPKEIGLHLQKLKEVMQQIDVGNVVQTIYTDNCKFFISSFLC